ncbi:hypothetical protein [Promicromonospora soli]
MESKHLSSSETEAPTEKDALRRAESHERLGMFLAEYEELHGPISQQEIDDTEAEIRRADAERAERARVSAARAATWRNDNDVVI